MLMLTHLPLNNINTNYKEFATNMFLNVSSLEACYSAEELMITYPDVYTFKLHTGDNKSDLPLHLSGLLALI